MSDLFAEQLEALVAALGKLADRLSAKRLRRP